MPPTAEWVQSVLALAVNTSNTSTAAVATPTPVSPAQLATNTCQLVWADTLTSDTAMLLRAAYHAEHDDTAACILYTLHAPAYESVLGRVMNIDNDDAHAARPVHLPQPLPLGLNEGTWTPRQLIVAQLASLSLTLDDVFAMGGEDVVPAREPPLQPC